MHRISLRWFFQTIVTVCLVSFAVGCSDDDKSTAPGVEPQPVTLVAADRNGDIHTVNESNGLDAVLIDTWMDDGQGGSMDVGVVSSMIYVPSTGKWWLGTGGQAACPGCILTLDPGTGEATVLSTDGGDDHGIGVSGLAIHPTSGRIITFYSDGSGPVYEIDSSTGAWTEIYSDVETGGSGNGTTFTNAGQLYVIGDDELWHVDLTTGTATLVDTLTFTGFPAFEGARQPIGSLTTRPSDGAVLGILMDGGGNGNQSTTYLVRVNLQTAEITNLGANAHLLDGLAFVPTSLVR